MDTDIKPPKECLNNLSGIQWIYLQLIPLPMQISYFGFFEKLKKEKCGAKHGT